MTKGIVFNIMRYSVHDGPGIRTTVFFKGCPLNCLWCHNPESIKKEPEQVFYPQKCIKCGQCDDCPTGARETIGKEYTVSELMDEIKKDVMFFDQSKGGVTFSGGEPLFQSAFLLDVLKACQEEYIHTAVDTSGFCGNDTFAKVAEHTRLFLYDIKFADSVKHEKYCGVPNKVILENLKQLADLNKRLLIRIPVIPTINDDMDEMNAIFSIIKDFKNVDCVHLLPYHNIQTDKYKRLGLTYELDHVPTDESKNLTEIKEMFAKIFKTKIGG